MPAMLKRAVVDEHASARDRAVIAKHINRFLPHYRGRVSELTRHDVRIADLAISFPALLFALAVPRFDFDRAPAIRAVVAGMPLKDIARIAGVPFWARKLTPEAFSSPETVLPDGELFAHQIVNHLPPEVGLASRWLAAVCWTFEWATPGISVWIAREFVRDASAISRDNIRLVALYAWFSGAPQTTAGAMIARPWRPEMRFETARDNADTWHERVTLRIYLGGEPLADAWLGKAIVDGFCFVPLLSEDDICAEAAAMQNCLRSYGGALRANRNRLWSVRKNGTRVATLRIGTNCGDPFLRVVELFGPKNEFAPEEVWWAARKWVDGHDREMLRERPVNDHDTLELETWVDLWRPYWLAKRRFPSWLPLAPSHAVLWDL